MCNADTGVITFEWVQEIGDPYPNFNTRHKCRNYNKLVDWYENHKVHLKKADMTRLEDTVDLPKKP